MLELRRNLLQLALITIPIIVVIGLVRVNFGTVLSPNHYSFQHNYLAVVALTLIFMLSWGINILLLPFYDRPVHRYLLSYIVMALIIWGLIHSLGKLVFPGQEQSIIHPFWSGLIFNMVIIALTNFAKLKTSRDLAEYKVNELKRLQLEAEKKLLIQQLQPHFLFNALSTLKSLINENPGKASDYTVQLSEFLRYTITSSKEDTVSVKSELDFTKDYIRLQSERFLGAVVSQISLPPEVLQMHLPVYSLQTLVENAFKHNTFSEERPMRISIYFEEGLISVENSKSSPGARVLSTGTGLKNLEERFQIIADAKIILTETTDTFKVSLKPLMI